MRPTIPDDGEILAAFDSSSKRPMHVAEIADRLGLHLTARRALGQALDAMASRGLLAAMPGSRYRVPTRTGDTLRGVFSQNPRGFGFVAVDTPGPDVYVPATSVRGAMHGDRVTVQAFKTARGREGTIQEITLRRSPRIPGTLRMRAEAAWVEPDDARIRGPIPLEGHGTAGEGDAVVCEIVRWPEHTGELPLGNVTEALGKPGVLDVEVRKVLLREGIEETFEPEVLREAETFGTAIRDEDRRGREDLRKLALLTIDPQDARDHDDAVCVHRRDDGGFTVWVAIADVSHYVQPGTALDASAYARGTSIYLPDRAIPMLPFQLSAHLASLVEGEDRLTFAIEIQLDSQARVTQSRLIEGVMRCQASLTYHDVAGLLGWSDLGTHNPRAKEFERELKAAADVATILRARRTRRGSLDFDLPEPRVKFGPDGQTPIDIVPLRQDPGLKRAYGLVEELMLLANETIAALCVKRGVPTIFRVHGEPEGDALEKISSVARAYGHDLEPAAARDPKRLSAFLRKIAGTPAAPVISYVLLRSLPQAVYQTENIGHFGLAAGAYLHFTSPIRRYPDVVAHRVARQILRDSKQRADDKAIAALQGAATESSRAERRSLDVERDVASLYACQVGQLHVGEVHSGVVTGLSMSGPFVQLVSPFIDVLVRVADLAPGEWTMDELGLRLTHHGSGFAFALGDPCVVQISDVSIPRRTIYGTIPAEHASALRVSQRRDKKSTRAAVKTAPQRAKTSQKKKRRK